LEARIAATPSAELSEESIERITAIGQRTVKTLLRGERLGWNNMAEWAAKWIEGSLAGETNERTIEFARNMAMSIRAAKRTTND
jgi:hypothetical protein